MQARDRHLLVLTEGNATHFEGDCWPGRSAWVDYLLPEARAFWAGRFGPAAYGGSTRTLYTWNDMNEPSVFDGPEITMRPSLIHRDGQGAVYEHRELHNLYGMLMHMSTHEGQRQAYPDRRPFVLTRAFFAGSQRYAAVWTGDNKASWAHLAATTPMLLSLSVAGIPFVGADVGGFFGNPSTALLVRWYQAAVFHPFLRAHAEFKTKRREPYLFGEEITRQATRPPSRANAPAQPRQRARPAAPTRPSSRANAPAQPRQRARPAAPTPIAAWRARARPYAHMHTHTQPPRPPPRPTAPTQHPFATLHTAAQKHHIAPLLRPHDALAPPLTPPTGRPFASRPAPH